MTLSVTAVFVKLNVQQKFPPEELLDGSHRTKLMSLSSSSIAFTALPAKVSTLSFKSYSSTTKLTPYFHLNEYLKLVTRNHD